MGAGGAVVGVTGSRTGIGPVFDGFTLVMPRTPSGATTLLPHSGLCPLGGHGAPLLDGGLSHPLCDVTEPSPPPHRSFSCVSSALYIPFPILLQASWGKWLAQGLTERRQINTVLIGKETGARGVGRIDSLLEFVGRMRIRVMQTVSQWLN